MSIKGKLNRISTMHHKILVNSFLIIFIYYRSRRKLKVEFELLKTPWTQSIKDFRKIYILSAVLSSHRTLSYTPALGI